jgi:hypothetical protein
MRNVLIRQIRLNATEWEIVKELPSTSNQWDNDELSAIKNLLESDNYYLCSGNTEFHICK